MVPRVDPLVSPAHAHAATKWLTARTRCVLGERHLREMDEEERVGMEDLHID